MSAARPTPMRRPWRLRVWWAVHAPTKPWREAAAAAVMVIALALAAVGDPRLFVVTVAGCAMGVGMILGGAAVTWQFGHLRQFGYDVVCIDPPWNFDLRSARGEAKSPQAQYRTMSLDEVKALRVGDLVGAGGIVFLWITWPLLVRGAHLPILDRWGFVPSTGGVWSKRTASGKIRVGTGYVQRSGCDPYVIGKHPRSTFDGRSFVNVIEALDGEAVDGLAREHSRKPDEMYRRIEAAWPNGRYADVFSRTSRPGWDCWGDEAGKFDAAPAGAAA